MRFLVSIDLAARVLVSAQEFLPNMKGIMAGRDIENPGLSWLGPCFCPSGIDDELVQAKPHVSVRGHRCAWSRWACGGGQSMSPYVRPSACVRVFGCRGAAPGHPPTQAPPTQATPQHITSRQLWWHQQQ